MPYHIAKSGKKFCVIKGASGEKGEQMKCYPDRESAVAYLKALYANEKKPGKKMASGGVVSYGTSTSTTFGDGSPEIFIPQTSGTIVSNEFLSKVMESMKTPVKTGSRIRLYFSEDEATPDGRFIDAHSINFNRQPPFPFRIQTKAPESGGHAGAELAGVLTSCFRDGTTLIFEGPLDMGSEAGRNAERLIREGFLQTWSPDLGDVTWDEEVLAYDTDGHPTKAIAHVIEATYLGGTAVALPALASAVIELLDDEGNIVSPKLIRGIAACGASDSPPAAFFTNPDLTELQRWTTITPEGRVFGHAAGFGECHIGISDRCITIDMIDDCRGEGDFEYAMPGHVVTAEGIKIGTGPIPIKGGHAPKEYGWKQALSYYADTDSAVADVVYGMDSFGVWFSGALRPTATKEQVYVLRASGVSLDAREIEGRLRYLLTCCVNSGGFPKVSVRLVASSEEEEPRVLALVAAGGPPEPFITDDCLCCDDDSDDSDLPPEFADLDFRILDTRVTAAS